LSRWHVHIPAAHDVLDAIGIQQRIEISFWDAMIIRSAAQMGCAVLYSEDLDAGREDSGVPAENPFQSSAAGRA
jgi:predicted nucleic acid-binding protein